MPMLLMPSGVIDFTRQPTNLGHPRLPLSAITLQNGPLQLQAPNLSMLPQDAIHPEPSAHEAVLAA